MTADLGTEATVGGVEMTLGGFVMDFPRQLSIETSLDNARWSQAWTGNVPLLTISAALEDPLHLTLPFEFVPRSARYVRFTQTGSEDVYYWSIAELRIHGRK